MNFDLYLHFIKHYVNYPVLV